ncbi:aryl hydrocarbon receptor-like isoform X2 [Betta splendens]|uniref:Aryl hydrocarbon receptor n=1 Tax=Betta splendens TaxID=158456 RepID=A0A6P7LDV5_BETSP|nr:aryl hydrocarbon receptor-like isoform X2 [Betta splendens]
MLGNHGTYASKKRKKPVLKQKKVSDGNEVVKSNPSKRHRDRLNGELDRLTDLLPFPEDIRTRLDKLSVLRLSVGYLRVKSYFRATMKTNSNSLFPVNGHNGSNMNTGFSEGDLLLQALNGFVIVVSSEGLVFYASSTIKDYLGFHQSDVVHQSVFELIHTDDRATFRQNLHFALNPSPADESDGSQADANPVMYNPEQLPPENSSFLERNFVCRFRCLLDNSSGFLALKFMGRLKYLHGQTMLRDNGTCTKSQLALFAIAMPVQPPSIVEIRAKMLLFQTKHKLDFTPMGVCSRGKIVLGYSEVELCMKGSGYQFIHAADMMHCADNHLRMIKTGESGLTVFRLLSKSAGWVWVQANAKLIYKGGRPEFIIAYQRALVNSEGEEYLRQRRLQLPFSLTTGEAILYNTGPTVDINQFQFNKMFNSSNKNEDVNPGSLLDCFLRQDESAYTPTEEPPLPVDQVFMDSRALVSVPSDAWNENGTAATTSDPVVVKEEAKQSVMAVIDNFEKLSQNGDFTAALQDLDVDQAELAEWENALKNLSQNNEQQSNVRTELDSLLTNDIFDYIDEVLFKEKGVDVDPNPPSCLMAVTNNQQDPFAHVGPLFQTPSAGYACSPVNGFGAHQQSTRNGSVSAGQSLVPSAQTLSGTQKLSHQGPLIGLADTTLPRFQQLQLQDIFSTSMERPIPQASADGALASPQSCGQVFISPMGCPQGIPGQMESNQPLLCPQNNLQLPAMTANGHLLQSSVKQPNNVASGIMDILPPLIPCNDFSSSATPSRPIRFATASLHGTPHIGTHDQQVQSWNQSQQQKLPHSGLTHNGHEPTPTGLGQTSANQTFPHAGLWPRSVTGLNHMQQGGLACGQAANPSSCMYDQHCSSGPAGSDLLALPESSLDQSDPQGSWYFQWSHSEPVDGRVSADLNGVFAPPPPAHDGTTYLTE